MLSSLNPWRAGFGSKRRLPGIRRRLILESLESRRVLAGLLVVESGGTTFVSEASGTDTLAVSLTEAPTSSVVLNVASSDTSEAVVSAAQLTFTPANFNVAQTITITGVEDALIDGNQSSTITISVNDTLSDTLYATVPDESVNSVTIDNDFAGIAIVASGGTTVVSEAGATDTLAVSLTAQPNSNVVLNVASSDTGEATATPATLTFTPANWNVAQTVTLTGVDDTLVDGIQTSTTTISVDDTQSDNAFDAVPDRTALVSTTDNDVGAPGFFVMQTDGATVVSESGTTDTFTVVLTAQPTSNVMLNVVSSDTGEATAAPTPLTFTPANWNVPQTITVTGVDDSLQDGSQTSTITISVDDLLSDNLFDAVLDQTVSVTTLDNDTAVATPGTAVLVPNPDVPGTQMLVVTGTSKSDHIRVRLDGSGNLVVTLKKQTIGTFTAADISLIVVNGLGGNDHISIDPSIDIAAQIDGGAGNDHITGGGGDDRLVGGPKNDHLKGGGGDDLLHGNQGNDKVEGGAGDDIVTGDAGNDHLIGGDGRDILIGGTGNDHLVGGADDDILIGGTTSFDANDEALQSLLSEWASDRPFDERVSNLELGTGDILEGMDLALAEGTTVLSAGHDKLNGGAGQNLLFGSSKGEKKSKPDKKSAASAAQNSTVSSGSDDKDSSKTKAKAKGKG